MDYRTLGDTGLRVSELCLGTMTFGDDFYNIAEVGQDLATKMVETSLDAGVNFFDTADIYSYGQSEQILGQALREIGVSREQYVVATKVRGPMSDDAAEGTGDVNNVGLSRKHIREGCERSLERLGVDTIDLYQVHGWDRFTPVEETMQALHELVEQDMVRYIGCSNWPARHLMKALQMCRERDWHEFVSLQAYYSLANRDLEHELQPLCVEEGLGILPWSPLAGGLMTGKYEGDRSGTDDARRVEFDFPPVKEDKSFEALDEMEDIAHETGMSIPQVALSWVNEQPAVDSVIIGASNMQQLQDNLGSAEVSLSAEQLGRLNDITQPDSLYPEWMVQMQNYGELPDNVG